MDSTPCLVSAMSHHGFIAPELEALRQKLLEEGKVIHTSLATLVDNLMLGARLA